MASAAFPRRLVVWFRRNRRPMPWRLAPSPYACWLSEIMMQQTTYAAVLPYYERFLKRFPTVGALAAAPEQEVLRLWAGLGYYARARNLHAAAKAVAAAGRFPADAAGWRALPGIGPYTAAALASVLSNEKIPVVDGNVARVFARYWALPDDFKKLPAREKLAVRLVPAIRSVRSAGDFNQAMMELGALVCTPSSPDCARCPLAPDCRARRDGTAADFPRRAAKKALPVRHESAVLVADGAGRVLLAPNTEGGLLKGLWELPRLAPAAEVDQAFSHFRLALGIARAAGAPRFVDPRKVPLSASTRKALVKCSILPS